MAEGVSALTWHHTYPDDPGFGLSLHRAREGEPEIIGTVRRHHRSGTADIREGWSWSLTCSFPPVGIAKPAFAKSGFEEGQRAARDALVAAWRKEEAWRAEVRASEGFESLPRPLREIVTHGQPVPPKRVGS